MSYYDDLPFPLIVFDTNIFFERNLSP